MRGMADFWSARSGAKGRLWLPAAARATWLRWLTAPPQAAIWPACRTPGEVAEWLKAADCKSARASVRWFESSPLHQHPPPLRQGRTCGDASISDETHPG